jgi:hypothetical protein
LLNAVKVSMGRLGTWAHVVMDRMACDEAVDEPSEGFKAAVIEYLIANKAKRTEFISA